MADGYLVAEVDETSRTPTAFWSGTVLQEDMQAAILYPERTAARLVLGAVQGMYPEKEMALQPASQVVQLVDRVDVPSLDPRAVAVAGVAAAPPPEDEDADTGK